jgi:hypothetical protein
LVSLRRNCLLKHAIEGKVEETERGGRRRKQLLDVLKETRRYWKLKEEEYILYCRELDWEEIMDLS